MAAKKKKDVMGGLDVDLFAEAALADDDEQDDGDAPAAKPESVGDEVAAVEDDSVTEDEAIEEQPVEPGLAADEQVSEESEVESDPPEELQKGDASPEAIPDIKRDESEAGIASYVVQRGFTAAHGKVYHTGDTIAVKCQHCALWRKKWLGKVRCQAGHVLGNDEVMSADKWSCGAFFICKEFEPELNTFLEMATEEVLVVRQMITGMKTVLAVEKWFDQWADGHAFDGDRQAVMTNARGFMLSFSSLEQLRLAEPYLRQYTKMRAKKEREKRPPRPKYEAGDWAEWTDLQTGERYSGIVLSKSHGKIYLAGVNAQVGQKFTFKYKEWKKGRDPKIIRKSSDPDKKG